MSIEFDIRENVDGSIDVSWIASTRREWHQAVALVKGIPDTDRVFSGTTKRWTVSSAKKHLLYEIVEAFESGKETFENLDEIISDELTISVMANEFKSLSPSMKVRALFAIKAAVGFIDAPVEFCISEGLFGAFDKETNHWNYENGRYSSYSPSEKDEKVIKRGYQRLQSDYGRLQNILEELDNETDRFWKKKLRNNMLAKYQYKCYICETRPLSLSKLEMHRVLPGKEGGQYIEDNIVIVCRSCHRRHEGWSWEEIHEAHNLNGELSHE